MAADFDENFQEEVAGPSGSKEGKAAVTTASDEVEVVVPVVPFETVSHLPNQIVRPKTEREKRMS